MKLLPLLGLVVLMALPAHTWKPPDYVSKNGDDTLDMLNRSSSKDSQQYVRALRNYILPDYSDPTGQGISRQLRGRSITEKCKKAGKLCKKAINKFLNLINSKKSKPSKENYHPSDPTDYGFLKPDINDYGFLKPDIKDYGFSPDQTDFGNKNSWMKCKAIAKEMARPKVKKQNLRAIRNNIDHETGYSEPADITSFDQFKIKFNKTYGNKAEEEYRKTIFQKNIQSIEDHNRLYELGERSYMKQVFSQSDINYEEFSKQNNGCVKAPNFSAEGNGEFREKRLNDANIYQPEEVGKEPTAIDYRQCEAINPIRHQRKCGSCWAFSVISSIESQIFLKYRKQIQLSEQEMVDCSPGNCSGGDTVETIQYYVGKGIALRESYPYTAKDEKCNEIAQKTNYKVSGMLHVRPKNDNDLLNALVHKGPISVLIHSSENFQEYKKGVLDDDLCEGNPVNHAVVLVGYGTEKLPNQNPMDYWLIRNSHGIRRQDEGYVKLARYRENHCNISESAVIPQIQ